MRTWRNGRRASLRCLWGWLRAGSSPVVRTIKYNPLGLFLFCANHWLCAKAHEFFLELTWTGIRKDFLSVNTPPCEIYLTLPNIDKSSCPHQKCETIRLIFFVQITGVRVLRTNVFSNIVLERDVRFQMQDILRSLICSLRSLHQVQLSAPNKRNSRQSVCVAFYILLKIHIYTKTL